MAHPRYSGSAPMKPSSLPSLAYFSMEIALEADMPTYSGGLGVLAGDTLRSAADLGIPIVAVTLLHRKGYFRRSEERRVGKEGGCMAASYAVEVETVRTDASVDELRGRVLEAIK